MDSLLFENVNEEGEVYASTFSLEAALVYLEQFPNDTIVISVVRD